MKTFAILIILATALAQNTQVSTPKKIRIKGLNNAVRAEVIDALVKAGYSVPPAATKEDLKAVKEEATTDGVDLDAVEEAAIIKFLDQGVTDGTIDGDVAADFLANRGSKQLDKDLKAVFRGVNNAVELAQISALADAQLIDPNASKKDIKAAKKQASAAGVDLKQIKDDATAEYLKSVDPALVANFLDKMADKDAERAAKKDEKKAKKQAERKAKQEAKQAEREAKKAAKKAEQAAEKKAEREAKKAAQKAEREAKQAAKKAEREAKKAAKKAERDAKKAEREAKKAAKKAEQDAKNAAKKAQRDAKKAAKKAQRDAKKAEKGESKVATRLKKKTGN